MFFRDGRQPEAQKIFLGLMKNIHTNITLYKLHSQYLQQGDISITELNPPDYIAN